MVCADTLDTFMEKTHIRSKANRRAGRQRDRWDRQQVTLPPLHLLAGPRRLLMFMRFYVVELKVNIVRL